MKTSLLYINTDERELERVLDNNYGGTVSQKHLYLSLSTCTGLWYNESWFFSPAMLMLSSYGIIVYYIIIQEGVMTTPTQLLVRKTRASIQQLPNTGTKRLIPGEPTPV